MEQAARTLLWFVFAGVGLLALASALLWWFDSTRRLNRGLRGALNKIPDAFAQDVRAQKAAGLDFTNGDLAILWNTGRNGLVFAFDEIDGAELIVDERVVARAQRGEPRRVLEETYANASQVVLRLLFSDMRTPEFELKLYGELPVGTAQPRTAAEAVQLGRKWLSHVDALIRRHPVNSRIES